MDNKKEIYDKICAAVDSLQEEMLQTISDIIRIPSVSPGFEGDPAEQNESKVNEYLCKVMQDIGLETDIWEEVPGRANLVGIHRGGSGRSLIFNGHIDVVPAGDPATWTEASPWSGEEKDGKIWGRGSSDMKAGDVAAIYAYKALRQAGLSPQGDIFFEMVCGEECRETEVGTGAAIKRGYRADAAIVVEPTTYLTRLNIAAASPGVADLVCTVKGKPVHACMRDEQVRPGGRGNSIGVNAIDKCFLIYQAMQELEKEWGQTKTHPLFTRPGHFTIGTGQMNGGHIGSIIADEATIAFSFWHTPQEKMEDLQAEVAAHIKRYCDLDPWLRENPPELAWVFHWQSYDVPAEHPICQVLSQCTKAVNPECGEIYGFPAVNDAAFINEAGIPAIAMGPGEIRYAHGANEFVEIRDIIDATKAYALTMIEWCGI